MCLQVIVILTNVPKVQNLSISEYKTCTNVENRTFMCKLINVESRAH